VGRQALKIGVDTNILVRAITEDDAEQSQIVERMLGRAETVAVGTSALCELVWVLERAYRYPASDIVMAIRRLIEAANVVVNRPAVDAGMALLEAGGDFADGVIAHEARCLGAETFVSFDRKAVDLVQSQGYSARLPAE
jgi:predicted nucleic-acid-binding protein